MALRRGFRSRYLARCSTSAPAHDLPAAAATRSYGTRTLQQQQYLYAGHRHSSTLGTHFCIVTSAGVPRILQLAEYSTLKAFDSSRPLLPLAPLMHCLKPPVRSRRAHHGELRATRLTLLHPSTTIFSSTRRFMALGRGATGPTRVTPSKSAPFEKALEARASESAGSPPPPIPPPTPPVAGPACSPLSITFPAVPPRSALVEAESAADDAAAVVPRVASWETLTLVLLLELVPVSEEFAGPAADDAFWDLA